MNLAVIETLINRLEEARNGFSVRENINFVLADLRQERHNLVEDARDIVLKEEEFRKEIQEDELRADADLESEDEARQERADELRDMLREDGVA